MISSGLHRWFLFKPKILIWVNFGVPEIEETLLYFMAIWEYFTVNWDIL
jgi:hypothetical protein